jgi:hypothetical protein
MGASDWSYVAPYRGDVNESLQELRERVFRDRQYWWWDDFEEDEPRPDTIELLYASEHVKQSGTHSILDVDRVVHTSEPPTWDRWREDLGTVRPLADDRVILHFGSTRPSRTQFQALADDPSAPGAMEFHDEVKMRGTGLYVLLYDGDQPSDVGFWGYSGD